MAKRKINVLFAGESWVTVLTEIKGLDSFTVNGYGEGARWLQEALERRGIAVTHMPCHKAITDFPQTARALAAYDCVILSDIGTNTLLLHPETWNHSKETPNRLALIRDYVKRGGALLMIGGYMTFQGIDAKARYHRSPVEEALPVWISATDDRVEVPEGFRPVVAKRHPIVKGMPREFPTMLFYNGVTAKDDATVILKRGRDPILTAWEYGKGRACAFAPDAAPHGATPEFLNWKHWDAFWAQMVKWLCRR
jgi:uncharacterized membrane protein